MLNSWLILFGVDQDYVVEECDSMNGVPIGFTWLKEIYEEHLTKAISLKNTTGREEDRDNHLNRCVRTFLLYQIGCTMFTDKNNKHIEVIFFEPPWTSTQFMDGHGVVRN